MAGSPDRIIPMPIRPGGPVYMHHEYFLKDRSVIVTILDGKVTGIADNHICEAK